MYFSTMSWRCPALKRSLRRFFSTLARCGLEWQPESSAQANTTTKARALIVQPDVLFISTPRLSIVREQVWGPPDLVAEVLSPGTEGRDRGEKFEWYRQYGVREYWRIDPLRTWVTVVDFAGPSPVFRHATGTAPIRSAVFPNLDLRADALFD